MRPAHLHAEVPYYECNIEYRRFGTPSQQQFSQVLCLNSLFWWKMHAENGKSEEHPSHRAARGLTDGVGCSLSL